MSFEVNGTTVKKGETKELELPLADLYTGAGISIPVFVKCGKRAGPTIFVSAAIHGDELNGIEIISRLLNSPAIKSLKGTLVAVPFVNGYGVLNQSRYLPDRRDLNRSFPGTQKGSLASRVAHTFFNEIVKKCDYGIDLHTGAIHRSNLPQIRANLKDEETLAMAKAFNVPVVLNSDLRDGSLRESANNHGIKILLYEAGEALRFDELSIKLGVRGVINTLRHLEMLPKAKSKKRLTEPYIANGSKWVRSSSSGFIMNKVKLGQKVQKGDLLANIKTAFGKVIDQVTSPYEGIVIGQQNIPLAQEGEALFHIASFKKDDADEVAQSVDVLEEKLLS